MGGGAVATMLAKLRLASCHSQGMENAAWLGGMPAGQPAKNWALASSELPAPSHPAHCHCRPAKRTLPAPSHRATMYCLQMEACSSSSIVQHLVRLLHKPAASLPSMQQQQEAEGEQQQQQQQAAS